MNKILDSYHHVVGYVCKKKVITKAAKTFPPFFDISTVYPNIYGELSLLTLKSINPTFNLHLHF